VDIRVLNKFESEKIQSNTIQKTGIFEKPISKLYISDIIRVAGRWLIVPNWVEKFGKRKSGFWVENCASSVRMRPDRVHVAKSGIGLSEGLLHQLLSPSRTEITQPRKIAFFRDTTP